VKTTLSLFLLALKSAYPMMAADAGWIEIPGTTTRLKIGGYVKLDLLHDLSPIGSPDYFDVSTIPTTDEEGQSTHFNVKETRLFFDARATTDLGEIRGYLESDFYGTNGSFRIRHAFVEIGGALLAGQEWSTFMDENIIPATLDFEKPGAYAFLRQGQIRYTAHFGSGLLAAIGIEEPGNKVADVSNGSVRTPLPDLALRVRTTGTWGHVQLSSFVGTLTYSSPGREDQRPIFYGINLSSLFKIGDADQLTAQVIYGPGIANYRGRTSAIIDSTNTIEPIIGWGVTAWYMHHWSPKFSSTLLGNYGEDDLSVATGPTNTKALGYGALNFLWHYAPASFAGIEYLYGSHELVNGDRGTASRIQISVRYAFNM
jgi:hypothetical protein